MTGILKSGSEVVPKWRSFLEQAELISDDPPAETVRLFARRVDITYTYAQKLLGGEGSSPSLDRQERIVDFCRPIIERMVEQGRIKMVE